MGGKFPDTRLSTQIFFSTLTLLLQRGTSLEKHPSDLHGATMQLTEFNIIITYCGKLLKWLSLTSRTFSFVNLTKKRWDLNYILTVMICMQRWIKWANWRTFSLARLIAVFWGLIINEINCRNHFEGHSMDISIQIFRFRFFYLFALF